MAKTTQMQEIEPLRGGSGPDQFWKFWEGLEKLYPERTFAYLYRGWPAIDRKRTGHKHKTLEKLGYLRREDILPRHGSGDYKLQLYDSASSRVVATTYVQLRDPTIPPKIDLRELKLEDPANAEYIADLRSQGIPLPGDEDTPMNNTVVEKLMDRMMMTPNADGGGIAQAVQVMGTAAQESSALLRTTFQEALRVNIERPDPVAQLGALVGVVEKLRPSDSGMKEVLPLISNLIQEQRQDRAMLLEAIQALNNSGGRRPKREDDEEDDLVGAIKAKLMEKAFESLGTPAPAPAGLSSTTVAATLSLLREILPIGQTLLQHFLSRGSIGSAVTTDNPQPTAAPSTPTPDPYQQMLIQVEGPLLRYWQADDRGGAAFAELLIEYHGREIYDVVRQAGKDLLLSAIAQHPRIGPVLLADQQRTNAFLNDFFAHDDIIEEAVRNSPMEEPDQPQQQQQQPAEVDTVMESKPKVEESAKKPTRTRSKAA